MKIVENRNGSTLEIAIDDCLDATSAPELEDVFNALDAEIKTVILDMSELEYVSSAGLRVLLNAQKIVEGRDGTMTVRHVGVNVMEVFSMTGFDEILTIEE